MAEQGKPSTRAKNKYNAKAYDQFLVTVPTGEKGEIDRIAEEQGYKSRNEFIVAAINEKKEKGENNVIEITESERYGIKIRYVNDGWKIDGYEEIFPNFQKAEAKAKEVGKTKKRY